MLNLQERGTLNQITKIAEVSQIKEIGIGAWPCPKVNNDGVTSSWSWKTAAEVAVAAYATITAYQIAKMQYNSAIDSWRLAREQWDYFLETFKPCEKKEAAEVCIAGAILPDYAKDALAYRAGVTAAYARADADIRRLSSLYCVCQDKTMTRDIDLMRSQFTGDGVNFAMRHAEAHAEALDDVRWNRRLQTLGRGRSLMQQSAGFSKASAGIYDQYGKAISSVASSAISAAANDVTRNETQYPTRNPLFAGGGYMGATQPVMEPRVWGRTGRASTSSYLDVSDVNPQQYEITAPTGGNLVTAGSSVHSTDFTN